MTDPATFAAIKAAAAHGTAARYEAGCRCDHCTTANRDKARRRRARRAADNQQNARGRESRTEQNNALLHAPPADHDIAPRWTDEPDDDWTDDDTSAAAGTSSLQQLIGLATQLHATSGRPQPARPAARDTEVPQRTSPVALSGHVQLAGGPCTACNKPAPLHTACPWCGHRPPAPV